MAEVTVSINGRSYGIACDNGQEKRVKDLGFYVDQRLKEISRAGAASNESHLLVLTALLLADEIFDARDELADLGGRVNETDHLRDEEALMARAIGNLAGRIDLIADRIQKA